MRNKQNLLYHCLIILFVFITACSSSPQNDAVNTPEIAIITSKPVTPTPTLELTTTSTITPSPTTLPSLTPTPTQTATAVPTAIPKFDYTHYEIRPGLETIAQNFPNLASSTSAQPIWIETMCLAFNVSCHWSYNKYDPGNLSPDLSYEHRDEFMEFVGDQIVATGTHEAYVALIKGEADIIVVARAPSEDEINEARDNDVELDVQPVALDAFVFIVNVQNPVDDLSVEQIQAIYSGEITNWKEVGGVNDDIHAYQRDKNSGSQELMESLVMGDISMIDAPNMIQSSMIGPVTAMEWDTLGLGYSVYFYIEYLIFNEDIEFIGVDGVEPTSSTIYNRTYPLTSEVYVVIRNNESPNSTAIQLREWLLSYEGQSAISSTGYVSLPLGE